MRRKRKKGAGKSKKRQARKEEEGEGSLERDWAERGSPGGKEGEGLGGGCRVG